MNRTLIIMCILLCFRICSFGQSEINILLDADKSAIASSENLQSMHKLISDYENSVIKLKYWDEDNIKGKALGIGYRLSKTIFLDFQIDYMTNLIQHEVFGHGYRFREFEYENNSFNLNLAIPFGSTSGFARAGTLPYDRLQGFHESIIIASGGMEANSVFASRLKNKWMAKGRIDYREILTYFVGLHDHTFYINRTRLLSADEPENDVNTYISRLNRSYGFFGEENYPVSLEYISNMSMLNLINTYSLFATYAYFKEYLFNGNDSFKIPMFSIGQVEWLPSARFGLTPFGSQVVIENFVKTQNSMLRIDMKIGDYKINNFWGGGLTFTKNQSEHYGFSTSVDVWNQPFLELGGINRYDTKGGLGARVLAEANVYLNKKFPIGLYGHIGYKTDGYIEGEQLSKGFIIRLGLSIRQNSLHDKDQKVIIF